MEEIEELPDCLSNCPLDDEPFGAEAEQGICDGCFLSSEEYEELSQHSQLFETVLEYLQAREVGLERPRESYTFKERQAIITVFQELRRQRRRRDRRGRKQEFTESHSLQGKGEYWIPACAGMTEAVPGKGRRVPGNDRRGVCEL